MLLYNDNIQIFCGFSDVHSLFDNMSSSLGIFEHEDLNPLICMFLLDFLVQLSKKTFSKIRMAAYRKRVNPLVTVFLTNSPKPDLSQLTGLL